MKDEACINWDANESHLRMDLTKAILSLLAVILEFLIESSEASKKEWAE